jgi:hypothetical protein
LQIRASKIHRKINICRDCMYRKILMCTEQLAVLG